MPAGPVLCGQADAQGAGEPLVDVGRSCVLAGTGARSAVAGRQRFQARELGGDCYQRRDPERLTKRLVARLQSLGHEVTLTLAAA